MSSNRHFKILDDWWMAKLRGKSVQLKPAESSICHELCQNIKRELEKSKNTHVTCTDNERINYGSGGTLNNRAPDVIVVVALFVSRVELDADSALDFNNIDFDQKEKTILLMFHNDNRESWSLGTYQTCRVSETIHVRFEDQRFSQRHFIPAFFRKKWKCFSIFGAVCVVVVVLIVVVSKSY